MGFFDRDVEGAFDQMFDLDRDGQLNPAEQAFQMEFLEEDMERQQNYYGNDDDDDDSSLF